MATLCCDVHAWWIEHVAGAYQRLINLVKVLYRHTSFFIDTEREHALGGCGEGTPFLALGAVSAFWMEERVLVTHFSRDTLLACTCEWGVRIRHVHDEQKGGQEQALQRDCPYVLVSS